MHIYLLFLDVLHTEWIVPLCSETCVQLKLIGMVRKEIKGSLEASDRLKCDAPNCRAERGRKSIFCPYFKDTEF